ncbi:MAG TPA: sugar-transfer associated ATP-grasp domain-containing protein [Bacteroidales bacterium]|jgi:hypothetical protein|nr:sugar-transfer associated ATP-grasp domain-containing protein [Bacteroidales bacterium]
MNSTVNYTKSSFIIDVIKDPFRKSIIQIIKELITLTVLHKEIPGHYFSGYLYKKDVSQVENYLPLKRAGKIVPGLNDQKLKEVLDNKLYFNLFYGQFNIKIPKIVMFNHGNTFCRNNESFRILNVDDFVFRLRELFTLNSSMDSVFIKKTYASSKGTDIYKINSDEVFINDKIQGIYLDVIRSEYVFQETIIQHSVINQLNTSSVNTIRMDTLLDNDGKVHVLSGYMRMSLKDHYVDNISRGGAMAIVDLNSGTLKKYAYPGFKNSGTKLLTKHPKTGTVFEGFKLPYIKEAIDLVSRAALLMPGLRIIGWDVAISTTGPVIVEGNSDYAIRVNDQAYGGYLAHPVFRAILDENHL